MPRFMSLIRINEQDAPDMKSAGPEFEQRMGALFEEITKAGVMLDTAGLLPTAEGTRITWEGGQLSLTDGPFTETKEVVGGYAIMQCKDRAEAVEWTKRFLEIHPVSWTVGAELRQIDGNATPPEA
ncbi:YciI family protein [Kitasatospora sp. NPDC059327]|uniref:YciI family protein n=1 Tax=Kitasatospora sp. NPDC059327 TaxID=3346803 RepID=UPI00368B6536